MIRKPKLVRSFHISRFVGFQRKSDSKNKMSTPRKSGGEFRSFRKAASYGNHHKLAPNVPIDGEGLHLVTSDHLQNLKEFNKRMVTFPDQVQASLVHLASYRPTQYYELFRTHSTLFRDSTMKIAETIEHAEAEGSANSRVLIEGASGLGKSTALTQAHSLAALRGWFVAHIPRAGDLTDGSSLIGSELTQPMFVRRWHRQLFKANRKLAQNSDILKALKSYDPRRLFETLQEQGVPTLVTVDDFNAWAARPYSAYRDTSNQPIYHGALEVPKLILSMLDGSFELKKGAVFVAVSSSFNDKSITIDTGLKRPTQAHPYMPITKLDRQLASRLASVQPLTINRFSVEESTAYFDFLQRAQVTPSSLDGGLIESHILSGNGNPRGIIQSCVNFSC